MKASMKKVNIDGETLKEFKSFVLEKHGKIRGKLHDEATAALKTHMGVHNGE